MIFFNVVFLLLVAKALCPSKLPTEELCCQAGAPAPPPTTHTHPGHEGSPEQLSLAQLAGAQKCSILVLSAPGREGSRERKGRDIAGFAKVSQVFTIEVCPAEIPFPGLHWAAGPQGGE